MNSAQELYQKICAYYDDKGIAYQQDEERRITLVVNRDREIPVNLFASAEEDPLSLRICGRLPFAVPEEDREMMVLAVQAMNQRLPVGRFQLDLSDGRLDYRVTLPLVGIETDEEWLDNVLQDAFSCVARRDEAILALLRGEMSFEDFDRKMR